MSQNDSYLEEDLGPQLTAINSVCIGLATIAVVCRFIARHMKSNGWWWDDWTALLSLIFGWAFYGLVQAAIPFGLGRHIEVVSETNRTVNMKLLYVYQIFYCLIPFTIKVSALFLYKRIFVIEKFIRWVDGVLWVLVAWGIASIIVDIFNCTPIEAFWNHNGWCVNLQAWVLGYALPGIVLNFVVWLTPIPVIWKLLNLSIYYKICLTIIFVIGLADCAVDIARLATITSFFEEEDITYLYAQVQWWNMLHTSLGIIAICLPTMRILISWIGNSMSRRTGTSSGPRASNSSRRFTWGRSRNNAIDLNEVGMALSGEAGKGVHNNAIALALMQPSQGTGSQSIRNGEIQVTRDVLVERNTPPATPQEVHLVNNL